MRQVELVRQRIIRGQHSEIMKLRQFLSMTDNGEALPKLTGDDAEKLLVTVVDTILLHIGHQVVKPKDGRTRTAKAL